MKRDKKAQKQKTWVAVLPKKVRAELGQVETEEVMTPFTAALKSDIDESVILREDAMNRSKFRFGMRRKMSSRDLDVFSKRIKANDSKVLPANDESAANDQP